MPKDKRKQDKMENASRNVMSTTLETGDELTQGGYQQRVWSQPQISRKRGRKSRDQKISHNEK